MTKMKVSDVLIRLIFVLAFNPIFFLIAGFEHPASVWIAYAMIHVSYLLLVLNPLFAAKGKTFFETSNPLFMLSAINFALHFIVGMIFILVAPEKCLFEIILYIILLAIYLTLFFILMKANAHTEMSSKRQSQEVFYLRDHTSKVKGMIGRLGDTELNKLLEKAADEMHSTPSRSGGAAASVESAITMKIYELDMAVMEERTEDARKACRELIYLVAERTRVLSMSY